MQDISSKRRRVDRYKTWGVPQSEADVCNTFVKYVTGEIESLPWSSTPLALESDILKDSLRIVNANGFLTINSQPSVNGAPSDDPTFGWGGKVRHSTRLKRYLAGCVGRDDEEKKDILCLF